MDGPPAHDAAADAYLDRLDALARAEGEYAAERAAEAEKREAAAAERGAAAAEQHRRELAAAMEEVAKLDKGAISEVKAYASPPKR